MKPGSATIALLALACGAGAGAAGTLFGPPTHYPTGTTTVSVAIADLNRDGRADLAAANSNSGNATLLFQAAGGGFGPGEPHETGSGPRSVAVADLDADGDLDVAVANQGSSTIMILTRQINGAYLHNSFPTGPGALFVAIADLDGDAKPDVATANPNDGTVSWFHGVGNGTFDPRPAIEVGGSPYAIAFGHLDGDAYPDLVVANRSLDAVSVVLAAGPGSFGSKTDVPMGNDPVSVALGDLNGDGHLDLATANRGPGVVMDSTVSVRLGDGSGGFGDRSDHVVRSGPESVAIGDLDGDGRRDLAVAHVGIAGVVAVLRGRGDGAFHPIEDYATGSSPRHVAIGDIDGDSRPDLATANYNSNSVSVLLNTGDPPLGIPLDRPARRGLTLWPNPTGGSPLTLAFSLETQGSVRVRILDPAGRRIRTMHVGYRARGTHALTWDGRTDGGKRAPAGRYVVEVVAAGARFTASAVILD